MVTLVIFTYVSTPGLNLRWFVVWLYSMGEWSFRKRREGRADEINAGREGEVSRVKTQPSKEKDFKLKTSHTLRT